MCGRFAEFRKYEELSPIFSIDASINNYRLMPSLKSVPTDGDGVLNLYK